MTETALLSPPSEGNPTQDLYQQLHGLITSGLLGAGERLPTVRQTARDLGVAPGTVAKAYKMLEQSGLVISRTAAGTRVSSNAAVLPRPVLQRVRDLVTEASDADSDLDDIVNVLRAVWQTEHRR